MKTIKILTRMTGTQTGSLGYLFSDAVPITMSRRGSDQVLFESIIAALAQEG
jgi:hypothetical protein